MLSNVPWAECVGAFYFLPRIVLPDLIHVATFPVPLKALFMRSYLIFKGSFGDRWWVGCRTEARLMCEGTSLAHSSIISPVEMRIFMPIGWALRRTQPDWYGWEHTHPLARSLSRSQSNRTQASWISSDVGLLCNRAEHEDHISVCQMMGSEEKKSVCSRIQICISNKQQELRSMFIFQLVWGWCLGA